jgi:transposase
VRRGRKEKQHSAEFKACPGEGRGREWRWHRFRRPLAQLSVEFGVHPTMISNWKQELLKRAGELFGSKAPAEDAQKVIDDLRRKIGQL